VRAAKAITINIFFIVFDLCFVSVLPKFSTTTRAVTYAFCVLQ
jgi:hypothetical protein